MRRLQFIVPATIAAGAFLVPVLATSTASAQTSGDTYFGFSGEAATYVVPDGVCGISVDASGAQGGIGFNGSDNVPGLGARLISALEVTPGEELTVVVGGRGQDGAGDTNDGAAGGFNGGGDGGATGPSATSYGSGGAGGGASDVRQGGSDIGDRVIVAGGGGGGGDATPGGDGGDAGEAGSDGQDGLIGSGTAAPQGGGGASPVAGGSAGANGDGTSSAGAGALASGGVGAYWVSELGVASGAGGGGGFFGGGGGGYGIYNGGQGSGGGGGGSSFGPDGTVYQSGLNSENGGVTITPTTECATSPTSAAAPTTTTSGTNAAVVNPRFTG